MAKRTKAELEAEKHAFSVQSLNFSRYIMIRYFSAAYLFANLFWLIFAIAYRSWPGILISAILLLIILAASVEQFSKWHTKRTALPLTRYYYWLQLGVNLLLAVMTFTPLGKNFLPFMTSHDVATILLAIQLLGAIGCLIIEKRIDNISHGRDKYAKVIQTFENNQQ